MWRAEARRYSFIIRNQIHEIILGGVELGG
jgi:hypothetical protein